MSYQQDYFQQWQALREACRLYHAAHQKGPGGARVCVCGAGGGGSQACSMLSLLRALILYVPTRGLAEGHRKILEELRAVV
jgi:hypothetical protein